MLRGLMAGGMLDHGDDRYVRAHTAGVWAGSLDCTMPEAAWATTATDAVIPTFSARTFLSPEEMKPSVWLLWQPDANLSLSAA